MTQRQYELIELSGKVQDHHYIHTPLLVAVTRDNVELLQLLMDYGADIRAPVRYDTLHGEAEGPHEVEGGSVRRR